jgi:predicted glycoside hydrolase/deacetylase ChbG (UPF0249 family)
MGRNRFRSNRIVEIRRRNSLCHISLIPRCLLPATLVCMQRLIVNADDFGLTTGVNRAIIECHQRGIVSSTTLMATGAQLDEAVQLATALPTLGVGCHVVLVDGEPLLPPNDVRSLLAPGTDRFYQTATEILMAQARGRFKAEEIEAEAGAQFARLKKLGVRLTHFDSHKHTHMFPRILRPLLRAAKTAGITAVRNPFEPTEAVPLSEALRNRTLLVRKMETTLLRAAFRGKWLQMVAEAGLATTDGSLGVSTTGVLNEARLRALLARIPKADSDEKSSSTKTWELLCHPGYNDAELSKMRTKLRDSRETERVALQSLTREALRADYGVELVGFGELGSRRNSQHSSQTN